MKETVAAHSSFAIAETTAVPRAVSRSAAIVPPWTTPRRFLCAGRSGRTSSDVPPSARRTSAPSQRTNGGRREAGTPRRGRELNLPLVAWATASHGGALPPSASFASVEPANVGLGALKRAEDDDAVVVRVYEAHGAAGTTARMRLWKPVAKAMETDLLERGGAEVAVKGDVIEFAIGPYEIKTLKVTFR